MIIYTIIVCVPCLCALFARVWTRLARSHTRAVAVALSIEPYKIIYSEYI